MTLQALKEAEFESSSLRVIPVTPRLITSLAELPVISYGFQPINSDEKPTKIFYDIVAKKNDRFNGGGPNGFQIISKHLMNALAGLGLRIMGTRAAYWDNDRQFVAQTMQNLFNAKLRSMEDRKRVDGAAIHGLGAIYVPLAQGATFRINQPDYDDSMMVDWDIIVNGQINFFGEVRPFAIHHPHCQGFTLPDIDVVMEEAMAGLFKWFPFLDGHVAVINRTYVSNPIHHQDHSE